MFVDDFSAVVVYCVYTLESRHSQPFYIGFPKLKLNGGPRSKSTHIVLNIHVYAKCYSAEALGQKFRKTKTFKLKKYWLTKSDLDCFLLCLHIRTGRTTTKTLNFTLS